MKKLEQRKLTVRECGRPGRIVMVVKRHTGWEYYVHVDGEDNLRTLKREDFKYLK